MILHHVLRLTLAGIILVPSFGCRRREAPREPLAAPTMPPPPPPPLPYRAVHLEGPQELQTLQQELGAVRFHEVLKLNRIDLRHARKGSALMVPREAADFLTHSPFPDPWPAAQTLPQSLWVSIRLQAWAAFEGDKLLRWGPICSGRPATPTPAGLYRTNWRQKQRHSTFNGEWLLKWYVNIHNETGISFHEYELPGLPESHSCIRLSGDDSAWIYAWCRTWTLTQDQRSVVTDGTPVVVFGSYAHGQPRPWSLLVKDPKACRLNEEDKAEALRILQERVKPVFLPPDE